MNQPTSSGFLRHNLGLGLGLGLELGLERLAGVVLHALAIEGRPTVRVGELQENQRASAAVGGEGVDVTEAELH